MAGSTQLEGDAATQRYSPRHTDGNGTAQSADDDLRVAAGSAFGLLGTTAGATSRGEPAGARSVAAMVSTSTGMRGGAANLDRTARRERTAQLFANAAVAGAQERERFLNEIVELNCRVADAVAMRYRDRGIAFDDIRQTAYEGLIKAVRRYDPEVAEDLLTFAVPTIRGEIQRYLRDRLWLVRPPRHAHELTAKVRTAAAQLVEELGREPSTSEVCQFLGLDEKDQHTADATMASVRHDSLDRPWGQDGATTLGETLTDRRSGPEALEAIDSGLVLRSALRSLSEPDRRLLGGRFIEERTQADLAAEFGVSTTQVGRRLNAILRQLRSTIETCD